MKQVYSLILILLVFTFTKALAQKPSPQPSNIASLSMITFGSCNKHDKPQPLWSSIAGYKSNLWIWLGDNVYGDTDDMSVLKEKYDLQKARKEYKALFQKTPIIGIWDDHDYGKNDGGVEYAKKKESQQLLLDFLDIPKDAPQRSREGVYASYIFGEKGKQIKIILLDTRYFRDSLARPNKIYQPNLSGTILGEAQWKWLEKELTESEADIHIIASSIQVISAEHPYEKWQNFPQEREKLLNLLTSLKVKTPIILSGDRHIAEISKWTDPNTGYEVYDVTSSGLTHSGETLPEEANQYRVSPLIRDLNFGVMKIDWKKKKMNIHIM
jgi:alkaline phosphatase D